MNNKHLLAIALSAYPLTLAANDVQMKQPHLLGGATTVFYKSHNASLLPVCNLGIMRWDSFYIGNAFFKKPWVIAPASTTVRDGRSPLFNSNTCQGCYVKDGRGKPPTGLDNKFFSTLVRLSIPALTNADKAVTLKHGVVPEPVYGDQLQLSGIKGEVKPSVSFTTINGELFWLNRLINIPDFYTMGARAI